MNEQPSTPIPAAPPSVPPPAPPPLPDHGEADPPVTTGPWGALIRILTSPADAFALIRAKSPWLPPYLLLGLLSAATVVFGLLLVGGAMGDAMGELANMPEFADAPGFADVTGAASGFLIAIAILGGAFALVGPAIAGLVFALLLYLVGMIFGHRASFMQLFSLSGYVEMPALLAGLISIVALVVAPEFAMTLNLSASAFLPAGPLGFPEPGILFSLLSLISPFTVWTWILVALGLRHIGRTTSGQAWGQTLVVFAVVVLTHVAMASFSQAMTNLFGNVPMM